MKPVKPVTPVVPVKPGKKYTCAFKIGDGIGGSEKKIGPQKGAACVKACVALKRKNPTINGVTYGKRGCYCEYKQKRRNGNKSWKNCFLKCKFSYSRLIFQHLGKSNCLGIIRLKEHNRNKIVLTHWFYFSNTSKQPLF